MRGTWGTQSGYSNSGSAPAASGIRAGQAINDLNRKYLHEENQDA
jgi:hypothetical protein